MSLTDPSNATGWAELVNATPFAAARAVYDSVLFDWTIGILFAMFEVMLLIKTKNPPAAWITGMIFLSLYIGYLNTRIAAIMVAMLVLLIGGILYLVIFKS